MPRQDVPYGGAICRLKERIAEIWDKLGEKLHSINGVEGDAAGDVKIVSSDPAVVITNNAASHEIEIGLDSLELPSAAVTSVNGETGAVTLGAADIPSDGGSDVQMDIDVNKAAISACSSAITSEQLARQNADATLQTNINAVSASIPEMSTTPDPYKGVERDAQGRAFAADPASGATDKSLTTANWISQTGSGKPNNLLHNSGNEDFSGAKNGSVAFSIATILSGSLDPNQDYYKWFKVGKIQPGRYARITYNISFPYNNNRYMIMDAVIITARTQNINMCSLIKMSQIANIINPNDNYLAIAYNGTDINIYIKSGQFTHQTLYATAATAGGIMINASDIITPITPILEDPSTQQFYLEI